MGTKQNLTLAACSFEVSAQDGRIQLLPYGEFRAVDGRPSDVSAWYLTEENGQDVATLANNTRNDLVVDYEHQTLYKEQNGLPAPAAGWMRWLEFTPKGLFADVEWTNKAAAHIQAKEYRYISAVFAYDNKGYVRKIYHAALTNYPALDGMDEVLTAASAQFINNEEQGMLKLLQQLLGLPEANEEQITAALTALAAEKPQEVALSTVFTQLKQKDEKIAALSNANPDPSKFVSVDVMKSLQAEVAALSAKINQDKGNALIEAALASGKLLPAQKDWAANLIKTDGGLAVLSSYLETAQVVSALVGSQSDGKSAEQNVAALSAEQKAAAKMLGMSEAELKTVIDSEKGKH